MIYYKLIFKIIDRLFYKHGNCYKNEFKSEMDRAIESDKWVAFMCQMTSFKFNKRNTWRIS